MRYVLIKTMTDVQTKKEEFSRSKTVNSTILTHILLDRDIICNISSTKAHKTRKAVKFFIAPADF